MEIGKKSKSITFCKQHFRKILCLLLSTAVFISMTAACNRNTQNNDDSSITNTSSMSNTLNILKESDVLTGLAFITTLEEFIVSYNKLRTDEILKQNGYNLKPSQDGLKRYAENLAIMNYSARGFFHRDGQHNTVSVSVLETDDYGCALVQVDILNTTTLGIEQYLTFLTALEVINDDYESRKTGYSSYSDKEQLQRDIQSFKKDAGFGISPVNARNLIGSIEQFERDYLNNGDVLYSYGAKQGYINDIEILCHNDAIYSIQLIISGDGNITEVGIKKV